TATRRRAIGAVRRRCWPSAGRRSSCKTQASRRPERTSKCGALCLLLHELWSIGQHGRGTKRHFNPARPPPSLRLASSLLVGPRPIRFVHVEWSHEEEQRICSAAWKPPTPPTRRPPAATATTTPAPTTARTPAPTTA